MRVERFVVGRKATSTGVSAFKGKIAPTKKVCLTFSKFLHSLKRLHEASDKIGECYCTTASDAVV